MRRPSPRVCLVLAGGIFLSTIAADVGWLVHYRQLLPVQVHVLAVGAVFIAALAGLLGLLVEDLFLALVRLRAERRGSERRRAAGRQVLEETTDEIVARVVPFRRRGA